MYILALFSLLPVKSLGAIAFVRQTTCSSTSGTSLACTITAAASGNYLFLSLSSAGTATGISSVASTNTTWSKVTSVGLNNAANHGVDMWYGAVSGGSSGTTVTATAVTGVNHMAANISEFSGIASSNPQDGPPATNQGNGAVQTLGAFSANTNTDLVIAVEAQTGGTAATAPITPWNALTVRASGTTVVITPVYQIVSSTGSITATWAGAAVDWGTIVASFGVSPHVSMFVSNPSIITVGP